MNIEVDFRKLEIAVADTANAARLKRIKRRFRELQEREGSRITGIRELSDEELAEKLEYYQANSGALRQAAEKHRGAAVYDAVLWYEILPEVRRRLKERPGPDHGPYVDPNTGERLCVACGTPESDHPIGVGGHCYCTGAFRPPEPNAEE